MPIFYNFHILLATFYTIFGTNILIQGPVLVPVCCMFFVSQNIHTKQSPNVIKLMGIFFGIFMIFGKKNQREAMHGGPTSPVAATKRYGGRCQACGYSLRRLEPFFLCKKYNIRKQIVLQFQPNRSYGSPGI